MPIIRTRKSRDDSRLIIERPSKRARASVGEILGDMFLPAGYPGSVTDDYLWYQVFDSLQAFSSSIAGLLASRATLQGFGVGDASASADKALLLTIGQDVFGRLSTILFAWRLGTALEPEAKMYRLAADVFNDSAMVLDCLSPALPPDARIAALCCSSVLRALCGTAAGGAKAALSVHFARVGNIGDLNAKDSSQETVIGLLGMLCGYYVVPLIQSRRATWISLFALLALHLSMNYLAVRAVIMHTINRQRANILWSEYYSTVVNGTPETARVLSPAQVAQREHVFQRDGLLSDGPSGRTLGRCTLGSSLAAILPAKEPPGENLAEILAIFKLETYILWASPSSAASRHPHIHVCFMPSSPTLAPRDTLKAWIHAFEVAHRWDARKARASGSFHGYVGALVLDSLALVHSQHPPFVRALEMGGWDLSRECLVTRSPCTVHAVGEDERKKDR